MMTGPGVASAFPCRSAWGERELDDALWNRMFEVNTFGSQLMSKTVVGHMIDRDWSRIIIVTTRQRRRAMEPLRLLDGNCDRCSLG
jgi:NAD(P)-dependent dehydrogenase (short-subunit alcohol dehydrogenase family)